MLEAFKYFNFCLMHLLSFNISAISQFPKLLKSPELLYIFTLISDYYTVMEQYYKKCNTVTSL